MNFITKLVNHVIGAVNCLALILGHLITIQMSFSS